MRWRWWILFVVVAVALYAAALSNDVYNATSPPTLSWHVLLRKFYSIVAFALVAALFVRASGASLRASTLAIAVYSGGIEIGQHITNGHEPYFWNAFDVACGAVGGYCGAVIPGVRAK